MSSFGKGNTKGLSVGDLDGDGDIDAIAVYLDDSAYVWLNDGTGNLISHPLTPEFGNGGIEVTLGDIDGDGDLDAVIPRYNQLSQTIWVNDGAGNFSAPVCFAEFGGGYTMQVTMGDLDGDGDLDVVLTDNSNLDTTIWLNDLNYVMLPLIIRGS
jgi:hypothetical protein